MVKVKIWEIVFTKEAVKDAKKIVKANLQPKAEKLLEVLRANPLQNPPRYEKLVGDLTGFYSRRINIQHRLIYEIHSKEKIVKVVRMWTHYE